MGKKVIKFDGRFIKDYDENSNKGYFLEVDVEYRKNLFNLYGDLLFLPERNKVKNAISFSAAYTTKKTMVFT